MEKKPTGIPLVRATEPGRAQQILERGTLEPFEDIGPHGRWCLTPMFERTPSMVSAGPDVVRRWSAVPAVPVHSAMDTSSVVVFDLGPFDRVCPYCGARKFRKETEIGLMMHRCCEMGK